VGVAWAVLQPSMLHYTNISDRLWRQTATTLSWDVPNKVLHKWKTILKVQSLHSVDLLLQEFNAQELVQVNNYLNQCIPIHSATWRDWQQWPSKHKGTKCECSTEC